MKLTEDATATPWRTVKQAAQRANTGPQLIYKEVRAGRLRAARVGGRREIRTLDKWIDEWLEASAPQETSAAWKRPNQLRAAK